MYTGRFVVFWEVTFG